MSKKKKIYCIHCGKENVETDKKCVSCSKPLHVKDHEFFEYVVDECWDNYVGETYERIKTFITKFVQKYFYGIVVTASVVFTGVGVYLNWSNNNQSHIIPSQPLSIFNDYEMLEGCWHGEEVFDEKYDKFYRDWYVRYDDKGNGDVIITSATSLLPATQEIMPLKYRVFTSDGAKYLEVGSKYTTSGELTWDGDDNFSVYKDEIYTYKSQRISCDDMPNEGYVPQYLIDTFGENPQINVYKN